MSTRASDAYSSSGDGPESPATRTSASSEVKPYVRPPQPVTLALADPGAFVERRHNLGPEQDEMEPLVWWQARALAACGLLTTTASAPSGTDGGAA